MKHTASHITRSAHLVLGTALGALCMLASCSPTKSLGEDEVLYLGIKEISYGHKAEAVVKAAMRDTVAHGVITDVAHAVTSISDLLQGKTLNANAEEVMQSMEKAAKDKTLTREQREMAKAELAVFRKAMDDAKTEVDAVLACPPTGSLFGSSSMRLPSSPGVMIYNLTAGSTSRFGRWMRTNFAKQPITITKVNPRTRTLIARNTLRNYGFFNGDVEYDLLPDTKPQRAHLAYSVYPRQLYRLDSIEYRGFPLLMDSLLRRSMSATLLHRGDAFSVANLDAERTRIATQMRNRGYYKFAAGHIAYEADTLQRRGWVQLRVEPVGSLDGTTLRRYYIGNTDITLCSYGDYAIVDSIPKGDSTRVRRRPVPPKTSKKRLPRLNIKMRYSGEPGKPPLRLSAMRKQLFYREGMPYNHALMERVQEQLSSMGVFSSVQMSLVPKDTTATCDTLMVRIRAMLDKPYDSEFEAKLTSKTGGQLGPGAAYSLSKRNALRRGEVITFKVYGSYEWQTGAHPAGVSASAVNSYELGASLQMNFPRLVFPGTRRINMNALTSTMFKLNVSWLNRAGYFSMAEFGGEATYTFRRGRLSKHTFSPLKLKYASLLSTTEQFDAVAARNRALYLSMSDQLVPAMEYTYSLTSSRRAAHPGALTVTLKESGNIVSGIFAAVGRSFGEQNKKILGVPFAQFVKATVDMRKEIRFTPQQSLVGHMTLGALYSFGNSQTAPYSDLFSIGGANSIRAFCLRGIGPGRYNPARTSYSYLDQMGDLKFEANLEYRFPIVSSLYGALFLDCGNVWLMKEDEDRPGGKLDLAHFATDLALGTGFGLRYDLDFLVVRFDLGVGLHAPYDTGKSGYYNMPHFGRSLGFHFAIGYPF